MLAKVKEQGRMTLAKVKEQDEMTLAKVKKQDWDDACTEQVKLAYVVRHACLTNTPLIE